MFLVTCTRVHRSSSSCPSSTVPRMHVSVRIESLLHRVVKDVGFSHFFAELTMVSCLSLPGRRNQKPNELSVKAGKVCSSHAVVINLSYGCLHKPQASGVLPSYSTDQLLNGNVLPHRLEVTDWNSQLKTEHSVGEAKESRLNTDAGVSDGHANFNVAKRQRKYSRQVTGHYIRQLPLRPAE
ncbi:hypothetical protein BaRGS_00029975 [Batillaria attramentaria]|uniref:Uncharacterized protein n=1 Tax=Batillaria attramentaria TaxID=370345 RepID=A0ABD0JVK9_9CAEN